MKSEDVLTSARTKELDKEEDYEDMHGHLHGDRDFSGPVSKRKCTNVLFLIIFIILNSGLTGISIYILIIGNPDILGKGNDLRGHSCGVGALGNKRFMYFPNSTDTDWSLCIDACPYYYYENYYCIYDKDNTDVYYPEWGCFDAYETTVFGFYCVPAHADRKIVMKYLDELTRVAQIAVGDLYRIWDVISLSYLFSMAVGLSDI